MSVYELVIARDALDAIRAHASRAPSGDWEIGGRLLREQDRLIKYEPIENVSAAAGFFECPPGDLPSDPWLLVHSHPSLRWHGLSDGDVAVMQTWAMNRWPSSRRSATG